MDVQEVSQSGSEVQSSSGDEMKSQTFVLQLIVIEDQRARI